MNLFLVNTGSIFLMRNVIMDHEREMPFARVTAYE